MFLSKLQELLKLLEKLKANHDNIRLAQNRLEDTDLLFLTQDALVSKVISLLYD